MRRVLTCLLAVVGLVTVHGAAKADPIGFSGYYAPANWTLTSTPGDGSVNWSGAPASALIIGSNNGFGIPSNATIAIPTAGTVSFHWNYTTNDVDGPFWDPFGYLLNGTFYQLTNDSGPINQSGNVSIPVAAGTIFGFSQDSLDGGFGRASTTITQFDAPMPEPMSMILFGGVAVAGIAGFRRRMKKA